MSEPSKPKAPPFRHVFFGHAQSQHTGDEVVSTYLITEDGALNPIPEKMERDRETQVARIEIGSSQQHACQQQVEHGQESDFGIEDVHKGEQRCRDEKCREFIHGSVQQASEDIAAHQYFFEQGDQQEKHPRAQQL